MIENNKLIADFMNLKYDYSKCDHCGKINPITFKNSRLTKCCSTGKNKLGIWHYPKLVFYTPPNNKDYSSIGKKTTSGCLKSENLKYHESWNWLMPVVEKIDAMGYTTLIKNYGDEYSNFVEILNTDEDPLQITCMTAHIDENSKFELTYLAIVEFIKWYNKQNNYEHIK